MTYFNNAIQTKRELLTQLILLHKENKLKNEIDRIPIIMRPKSKSPIRCCVHKDRAVIKYKIMAMLGYNIADEVDELVPLKDYAKQAIETPPKDEKLLTIIDDACSSCVQVNYTVSNLCQGCEARPCQFNCPKDAIKVLNGKALIDHQKCVNCGICQKVCAYHAIAYLPVPCEESCPVNAISKNEDGTEVIDTATCINCGRCMMACPFGAIMEKSEVVQVEEQLKNNTEMVAMGAPALFGQFKTAPEKILNSIQKIGFTHVMEVAEGADITIQKETQEWEEITEKKQAFLTTSCCPAYTSLTKKHLSSIKPYVSHTLSPMIYTAQLAKNKYPNAKLVFIGPCLAKREEAQNSDIINHVLTFEELGAFLAAHEIEVEESESFAMNTSISTSARGFADSGGVANAIKNKLPEENNLKAHMVNGINRKSIKLLRAYTKKAPEYNLIEVMGCEGGCMNGPGNITPASMGQTLLKKAIKHTEVEDVSTKTKV